MRRVVADVTFMGVSLRSGDWFVANKDIAAPAAPSGSEDFDVFPYVEVVPYAALDSEDDHLPLAASQGRALKELVDDLDENKLDKVAAGNVGKILTAKADGNAEAALTTATTIRGLGDAVDTALVTEKAVAAQIDRIDTELEGKVDLLPTDSANNIVTSTEEGHIQLSGYTIGTESTMNTNPATASLTTLPNERAVANALKKVADGAVLYWNTN